MAIEQSEPEPAQMSGSSPDGAGYDAAVPADATVPDSAREPLTPEAAESLADRIVTEAYLQVEMEQPGETPLAQAWGLAHDKRSDVLSPLGLDDPSALAAFALAETGRERPWTLQTVLADIALQAPHPEEIEEMPATEVIEIIGPLTRNRNAQLERRLGEAIDELLHEGNSRLASAE